VLGVGALLILGTAADQTFILAALRLNFAIPIVLDILAV
jgi:hypothetical protein